MAEKKKVQTFPWIAPDANKRPDQVLAAAKSDLAYLKAQEKYNQQHIDLVSHIDSLTGMIQRSGTIIKDLEKNRSAANSALNTIQNSYPPPSAKTLEKAIAAYTKADNAVKAEQAKQKKYEADLKTAKSQLAKVEASKKFVDFTKKPSTAPSGGGSTKPDTNPKKTPAPIYKFNAPMVKSAYIQRGVQVDSARFDRLITDSGTLKNGQDSWKSNVGAKGVIQMSRHFADLAPKATNSNSPTGATSQIFDTQMYGFKFLYNPEKISMAWGIVEQFSPQFEAAGYDRAGGISVGLMKSAIQFQLVLNRIGDMSFIDQSGMKSSRSEGVHAGANGMQNPYPRTVDDAELKEIYKRGTMYDLEYLFKASGGFSSQYHSTLNGITADKGWLQPIPVELHLGEGMRYLVRISTLDVKHAIFDERMVPILTFVDVTCTRYFDGPEMYPTDQKNQDAQKKGILAAASTNPNEVVK